jgi:hypothetical protein
MQYGMQISERLLVDNGTTFRVLCRNVTSRDDTWVDEFERPYRPHHLSSESLGWSTDPTVLPRSS